MRKLIIAALFLILLLPSASLATDVTATLTYYMYDREGVYATARDSVSASNDSSSGSHVGQKTGFDVIRGYLEIPIPGDLASVASAYLYSYGDTDHSTTDFDVQLFLGTWSSLSKSEWDQFDGWTSGSAHTGTNLIESWNTSSFTVGWNIMEFNADGRAAILAAKGTTMKIAMISEEDVNRSQPTGDEYVSFESKVISGKEPFLRINVGGGSGNSQMYGVALTGGTIQ